MNAFVRRTGATLLAALLVAATACSARAAYPERDLPEGALPGGQIITREDIQRTGAHNAWEAIERANTHLTIEHSRSGQPSRISHRGVDSLVRERDVLVVVNGHRIRNAEQELLSIKAEFILFIQVLSGREAALQWGSEAANGVILVRTSAR